MTDDFGLDEDDVERLRDIVDDRKRYAAESYSETDRLLDEDHPRLKEAVSHLSVRLFQSTSDEVYTSAKRLSQHVDASTRQLAPVFRTLAAGGVEGITAEKWGGTSSASTWRVTWDRERDQE